MHALLTSHVPGDLSDGSPLPLRQLEWERVLQCRREFLLDLERHTVGRLLREVARSGHDQLHVEQFIERQPTAPSLPTPRRCRAMHRLQRVLERRETDAFTYVLGQCVLDLCDQMVEMIRDDSPDHAMAESFGGRVHRKHQPLRLDVTVFITLGKNDVLAWGELSPVVVLDWARGQEELSGFDRAVEKRLSRPRALDDPTRVLEHRTEDPQAAARGHDGLRHHPTDHGDVPADTRLVDWGDRRGVEVSMRRVVQQVFGNPHAEPSERFRPSRVGEGRAGPKSL